MTGTENLHQVSLGEDKYLVNVQEVNSCNRFVRVFGVGRDSGPISMDGDYECLLPFPKSVFRLGKSGLETVTDTKTILDVVATASGIIPYRYSQTVYQGIHSL